MCRYAFCQSSLTKSKSFSQPGDEWMLEQGMVGAELHLLDLTKTHETEAEIPGWEKEEAIANKVFDDKLAQHELEGWDG